MPYIEETKLDVRIQCWDREEADDVMQAHEEVERLRSVILLLNKLEGECRSSDAMLLLEKEAAAIRAKDSPGQT
jgi:hypothetical protein